MAEVVSNSWTWKAIHDFLRGMPVAHHVKIRFGLLLIVRTIAKPANRIAENLYRLFRLPPMGLYKIFKIFNRFASSEQRFRMCQICRLQFPTPRLGRLVNQRNPPGYWQVTRSDLADLGQIISFYLGFFTSWFFLG